MKSNRGYGITLVILLIAGGLGVWALGQNWVTAVVTDPGAPTTTEVASGSTIYPISMAGAWITLAGVLAIAALRGRWRVAAGALVLACAAAMGVAAIAFPLSKAIELVDIHNNPAAQLSASQWWIVVAVATVLAAFGGIATAIWGPSWRSLSAQQAQEPVRSKSAWDALDRGEDPTLALPESDAAQKGDKS